MNVSFVDNNDILKLISFQYSYDISDSKIEYKSDIPDVIQFDRISSYYEIEIDPS